MHPEAQIYSRVAGTAEMLAQLERRQLDIVLGFAAPGDPDAIAHAPMAWYGEIALLDRNPIPLAVLETPCRFREAAVRALEDSGRSFRIAVETPNLTTLRAAVQAGLGVTCRTHLFLKEAPLEHPGLPALPRVSCILRTGSALDGATSRLAELVRDTVAPL